MEYFLNYFQVFLVIWARIGAAFMLVPVVSSQYIPLRLRGLASFLIAMLAFPWVSTLLPEMPREPLLYALVILKEILIGLIMGFILSMIFASFQLGAQFFALQIGLGMSQVFDPVTQEETPLMGYLFYSVAVLVFLAIGGFHMVLLAVVDSFNLIPAVDLPSGENVLKLAVRYFSYMFVIALKIAIPVIAASIIIIVSLGILGKVAPQANLLILGLPLQWGVGIVMILVLIPPMVEVFGRMVENGINDVMRFIGRNL